MKISELQAALDYHRDNIGDVEVHLTTLDGGLAPLTVVCVDTAEEPPLLFFT